MRFTVSNKTFSKRCSLRNNDHKTITYQLEHYNNNNKNENNSDKNKTVLKKTFKNRGKDPG